MVSGGAEPAHGVGGSGGALGLALAEVAGETRVVVVMARVAKGSEAMRFVRLADDGTEVALRRHQHDAGVRLTEAIERDMVQVRLTEPFRFVVVGAPSDRR